MGLIDMMRAAWGNDRPEFDPAEGLIDQTTIDAINAAYKCPGWIWSEPGYEGHDYIWFDREGRFGTTYYHQDEFDVLYAEPRRGHDHRPGSGPSTDVTAPVAPHASQSTPDRNA